MAKNNAMVGVYNTHPEAETAVKELQHARFDMKKLSIVGKDYHTEEHVIGYYNAGDRMKFWGKLRTFWGGFWSLLLGSALFLIPGIGSVVVFGPLVRIVGAPEGAMERTSYVSKRRLYIKQEYFGLKEQGLELCFSRCRALGIASPPSAAGG